MKGSIRRMRICKKAETANVCCPMKQLFVDHARLHRVGIVLIEFPLSLSTQITATDIVLPIHRF